MKYVLLFIVVIIQLIMLFPLHHVWNLPITNIIKTRKNKIHK